MQTEQQEEGYGSLDNAGLELGGMDEEGGIELDGAAGESDATQLASLLARVSKRRAALEQQRKDLDDMLTALDEVEGLCRDAQSKHHNEHTPETLMA